MNQFVNRGDTAALKCTDLGGLQNRFQWQFNGSDIPGETSDELTLSGIVASDGGLYTCEVSNDAGRDNDSTYLFVNITFISPPASLEHFNGSSAIFICDAEAFPEPEYQWARADGADIRLGIVTTARELNFSSVRFGDEGGYFCTSSSRGVVLTSQTGILTSKS